MKKIALTLSCLLLVNFCQAQTTTTEKTQTLSDGTTEVTKKIVETNHDLHGTIITETNFTKQHGLAGTTVTKTTEKFRVTGLTPAVIKLQPGLKRETVVLEGENLDKIEGLYLMKNGEIVEEVQVQLGETINNTRKVNLIFNENYVQDSDLEFVVVNGKEVISIPGTVTYIK